LEQQKAENQDLREQVKKLQDQLVAGAGNEALAADNKRLKDENHKLVDGRNAANEKVKQLQHDNVEIGHQLEQEVTKRQAAKVLKSVKAERDAAKERIRQLELEIAELSGRPSGRTVYHRSIRIGCVRYNDLLKLDKVQLGALDVWLRDVVRRTVDSKILGLLLMML
jgi:hypothetical protein